MRCALLLMSALTACDYVVGLDRNPKMDAAPDAPGSCPPSYTNGYRYVSDGRPWVAAAQFCKDDEAAAVGRYTHLVVFSNVVERDAVRALAPNRRLWIGYADIATEGTYQWLTDEATTYAPPWNAGEPSGGGGTEDCAEMLEDGDINDLACNSADNDFVCECDLFQAVR